AILTQTQQTMKYQLILFLFAFRTMTSQEINLDNYCFLLGTLNDYNCRSSCMRKMVVDYYDKSENKLVDYNFEHLKNEFNDLIIDSAGILISAKLAEKINNDFIWEKS